MIIIIIFYFFFLVAAFFTDYKFFPASLASIWCMQITSEGRMWRG